MKVLCDYCGKEFYRRPSMVKDINYCSLECYHNAKNEIVVCEKCGKEFKRLKSDINEHIFCSPECAKDFVRDQGSKVCKSMNHTIWRRIKLRNAHLGKGEGKTYTKTFGRHTHRIVAEQMLGRSLRPGEVVHHINEDKRDNRPENLMVFPSQTEHARWHMEHDGHPHKRKKQL